MRNRSAVKTLTVRLRPEIYEAAALLARKRGCNLNELTQQSVEPALYADREQKMYDAATLLGEDAEECSVEFAFAAQAECVLALK